MKTVELVQVIRTNLERRGNGTDGAPLRIITQYWTTDGEFLCEVDPLLSPGSPDAVPSPNGLLETMMPARPRVKPGAPLDAAAELKALGLTVE